MAAVEEESKLKYFIAAGVLGMAVGNMFVARRMRSISKMKVPTGENMTGHSSSSSQRVDTNRSRRAREEAARQTQRFREFNYQREQQEQVKKAYQTWARGRFDHSARPKEGGGTLAAMQPSLITMGLSSTQLPSRKEIKDAYARLAMDQHPDKHVCSDVDDAARARLQRRFAESTEAYRNLLKQIDELEGVLVDSR